MKKEADLFLSEDKSMELLRLPYTEDNLNMVFILPKKRFGLAEVEKELTAEKFWDLVRDTEKYTDLNVNKFFFHIFINLFLIFKFTDQNSKVFDRKDIEFERSVEKHGNKESICTGGRFFETDGEK